METNEQGLTKEEKIMFGILGIILIIYFNIFSTNTTSYELTINEDTMVYKTENYTTGYIIFRILQLCILVILLISALNIYRKNKQITD